jgi:hypothetical protein
MTMGHYENGGSNEVGFATSGNYAAVWTVDTPYIDVIRIDFFNRHKAEILDAYRRGEDFSNEDGKTGHVELIHTGDQVDEKGSPKYFETASEYVAYSLKAALREFGEDYDRAVANGFMR